MVHQLELASICLEELRVIEGDYKIQAVPPTLVLVLCYHSSGKWIKLVLHFNWDPWETQNFPNSPGPWSICNLLINLYLHSSFSISAHVKNSSGLKKYYWLRNGSFIRRGLHHRQDFSGGELWSMDENMTWLPMWQFARGVFSTLRIFFLSFFLWLFPTKCQPCQPWKLLTDRCTSSRSLNWPWLYEATNINTFLALRL